jgi:hypothetical protein
METTYNWGFGNPECIISLDGMSQIVQTIHWNLTGERNGATGYYYATCGLGVPTPEDFTPYEQLTEAWFISQVEANCEMANIYANIDAQIESKLHPVIDTPPLPWVQESVVTEVSEG